MKHPLFIIFLLLSLTLLVQCKKDKISDKTKTLEIGYYKMSVPDNFRLVPLQGIDSYVGKIEGSGISISFDYGLFTSPTDNIPSGFTEYNDTINGHARQILVSDHTVENSINLHIAPIPQNPNELGQNSLAMYWFPSTTQHLEVVHQIFKSVVPK